MGIRGFIIFFAYYVYLLNFNRVLGQYITTEELRTNITCDPSQAITCGTDGVIALQSLYFYYHPACEGSCCDFDTNHHRTGADSDVITEVRRQCSGKVDCSLDGLHARRFFDEIGEAKIPSYVGIYYYCIPESRVTSICSDKSLVSEGKTLFLTSESYPGVSTQGVITCSCSVEVSACTSSVNNYIIDADMYLDETTCEQNIDFVDGKSTSFDKIDCRQYSNNEIIIKTFTTNYLKIEFNDNSEQNQEGYFFLGFAVSEGTGFNLTCQSKEQSICKDCGTPSTIQHGIVTLAETGKSGFGALADVICDSGYESVHKTLSCLETGLWNTTKCNPKDCGAPYSISNGTITPVTDGITLFGAKAYVICDEGFEMRGLCGGSEFQCGDGTCISNEERCNTIPDCDDELDELLCSDKKPCAEGQTLCGTSCVDSQFDCTDNGSGVEETSNGTISCLMIGRWEIVQCSPKDCGLPENLQHGSINLTEPGKTIYRSTADVICDTGYDASLDQISCQANGSWEFVTCIVDCGNPYTIKNGTINLDQSGLTILRSTATVLCDIGFDRSTESVTCLANGSWEPASCIIKDCGNLTEIDNGSLTLSIKDKTTYLSKAIVTCDDGFDETLEFITCQENGIWQEASCSIKDCGSLKQIDNGTLTEDETGKTTFLSKASVVCDPGFSSSTNSIMCRANGSWEHASCIIKDCGSLYEIRNGTLELDIPGQTIYLSTATVSCEPGFDRSINHISCQANGNWQKASCNIKDCGDPGLLDNGVISLKNASKTTYQSQAFVTCNRGYYESNDVIACQTNGTWQTASCIIKNCSDPNPIQNGNLELVSGETTYLSTARVNCEPGFDSTIETIVCQENGTWQEASCDIKDCGEVKTINNGTIALDQTGVTTYLATATVSCEPGFNRTIASIKCQANGNWEDAFCVLKDCGQPNDIENGEIIVDMDKTTYLYTAKVSCDIGYDKSTEFISCQQNGEWQPAFCTIKDCGALKTISNGKLTEDTPGKTTYLSNATLSCDNGYDASTESVTCQSDGEWEDAFCTIKDCGNLKTISNGGITLADNDKSTYKSIAIVNCDPGYSESIKEISCLADGQWQDATCNIKDCGPTKQIQNGTITSDSEDTTYLSSATLNCDTGFDRSSSSVICQANGTWQEASCKIKDCGGVKEINNGSISLDNPDVTTYLATAAVLCDPGFNANPDSIKCQSSGEWQEAFCVIKDCKQPDEIENGEITLDNDKTTYLSSASVTCKAGFDASAESISCLQDGKWQNVSCDVKDCGIPVAIENGTITADGKTTYLSVATVTCDTGFDRSKVSVLCQADGTWENAACTIKDCGPPRTIDNGKISVDITDKTTYLSKATVSCDNGYDVTPVHASIICQADGTWENAFCKIKDCGSLSSIDNGNLTLNEPGKTTYLSKASVKCIVGYDESVDAILCQANGQWQNASCVIRDCGLPNTIKNGSINLDDPKSTTYLSTASVLCDAGFDGSRQSISCLSNGSWQDVTCTIKDCGDVYEIHNGTITLDVPDKTTYQSKATVYCDPGFDSSVENISCQANRTWQSTTCVIKDCGKPGPIDNGEVAEVNSGVTTFLSKAVVTCDIGYNETSSSITCQSDGLWSAASCNIVDCREVNTINNGSITLNVAGKTTFQSTATVSCESGFDPSTETVSCQSDGFWQEALCIIRDCGAPNEINNGSVTADEAGKTSYLSTAKVSCNTGFDASTNSVMCQVDGSWQDASCIIKDCGQPDTIIEHGAIKIDEVGKTTYLSSASVTCDTGYYPTIDTITCQSDGSWNDVHCVITDCGKPPSIENGRIVLEKENGTVFVSKAKVECDTGYSPTTSAIICQGNGSWENSTCEINDCGMPVQIANGTIRLDDSDKTTYRSTATITCDTGFKESATSVSCQADGSWEQATCTIKDCGIPEQIRNGTISLDDPPKSSYLSTASVLCDNGFNETSSSIKCQANGEWQDASCNIKDCGPLNEIQNGKINLVTPDKTTYLSKATVICSPGYYTSLDTIRCQANGLWQVAKCDIIDCGKPPQIANGTIILDDNDKTTYLSSATVSCDPGFEESISTVSCQADGSWEEATCKIKDCGIPEQIRNGTITLDDPAKTYYLSTASLSCDTGFETTSDTIICQDSGKWQDANCTLKDCGTPNAIENGKINLVTPDKTTYLSKATAICNPGYNTSLDTIRCQANGSWEDTKCVIIDCGLPETLMNGTLSLDDPDKTTYLSTAALLCDIGFDENTNLIVCEASGKWQEAYCEIKDCGQLPEVDNGNFVFNKENKTTYGSIAIFECLAGFVSSSESITCRANGKWEDASCIREVIDCGSLPYLENGILTLTTSGRTQTGETASVSCNKGYIKTADMITCLNSGLWENVSCNIVDCGKPPGILHGMVEILEESFRTYDSVAYVTCEEGYRTKQQFVACMETGKWEESSCDPEDDDEQTFVILVATGGAVLFTALVLLVLMTYYSRTKTKSAKLHRERQHQRHYNYNFEQNESTRPAENLLEDNDIINSEIINTVEGPQFDQNSEQPLSDRELPESGHILYPQDIDALEQNVFSQHEPHMWHTNMSAHADGYSNGWDFSYRF